MCQDVTRFRRFDTGLFDGSVNRGPSLASRVPSRGIPVADKRMYVLTRDCPFCAGDIAPVRHLSLKSLLPDTTGYMTYEGSTTHPGCWETVVWLILNKPIYITAREVSVDPLYRTYPPHFYSSHEPFSFPAPASIGQLVNPLAFYPPRVRRP